MNSLKTAFKMGLVRKREVVPSLKTRQTCPPEQLSEGYRNNKGLFPCSHVEQGNEYVVIRGLRVGFIDDSFLDGGGSSSLA